MSQAQRSIWIFACHDYNRVAAMSMFGNTAQYFTKENAIATVKSRFSVPEYSDFRFLNPNEWGAPNVAATQTSFDADISEIKRKISQYLESQGYSAQDISNGLSDFRGIPNPNLGILLLCVNMPGISAQPVVSQPVYTSDTPREKPEYNPNRAIWAAGGVFVLCLAMLILFIATKYRAIPYAFNVYNLLIPVLMGCSLFLILQQGAKFKLIAVLGFIAGYILEVFRLELLIMGRINIPQIFSNSVIAQNLGKAAIPYAIAAGLGILFGFLYSIKLKLRLQLAAWLSCAGILFYFIYAILPQLFRMPAKNIAYTVIPDVIYVICLPICGYLLNSLSSLKSRKFNIGTGAIVWISICLGLTSLAAIFVLIGGVSSIMTMIFPIFSIVAFILLLCKIRAGFLLSVFGVSMTVFLNIEIYMTQNLTTAIFSVLAYLNPTITWLLIRNAWIGEVNYCKGTIEAKR